MSKIKEIVKVVKDPMDSRDMISYQTQPIDEYIAFEGERALTHTFLLDSYRKIMGRVLTIIDASVHEKQQNKAMKDLVRRVIGDEMDFSSDFAFDQEIMNEFTKNLDEGLIGDPVDIEDVLGIER